MKRLFIILFILLFSGASTAYFSQTGGTKREGGSRKHGRLGLKRTKSKGHADEFARSKKKGIFARLFRKDPPSWVNRTTGSKTSNYKANRKLFRRHKEMGHIDNQVALDKQNSRREKRRDRGNKSFSSKKYKSK